MSDLLQKIQSRLEAGRLAESLTPLFCETLRWGAPRGLVPRALAVGAPVGTTINAVPVAQLSGLPVYRIEWPDDRPPGVTARRAVQKALAPVHAEHLLCYVARNGRRAALTWARRRADGKTELRTLPYEVGTPARTTVERLGELAFTLDDLGPAGQPPITAVTGKLDVAFSVERVTKQFYQEIANWYFWALEQARFPKDAPKQDGKDHVSLIRLITRVIFSWFLKEKGLIPNTLFDPQALPQILNGFAPDAARDKASVYYKAVLQNLFFATLNTEMDKRAWARDEQNFMAHGLYRHRELFRDPAGALRLFSGIPFLNGGLFECLDRIEGTKEKPRYIRIDGFSRRPDSQPVVPDFLFFGDERQEDLSEAYGEARYRNARVRGLVHTLASYNFTLAENTPLDQEVALDPELLGKVFENLLAAYNPETRTTARKATGSYYTPREIVDYMVDEALIAALATKLRGARPDAPDIEARLRHLFAYNDEPHRFGEAEVGALIEAIDHLKILDPACGSGAFPMGVLHKLVFVLGKLDPGNARWKARQLAKAAEIPDATVRERVLADIEQAFGANELDYGRKLYLIENCIYGVDIQPIAVQIAKLRFFISLVVDQRVKPEAENLGVRALPNLETKFVAANTLIGLDRPAQMAIRDPRIDGLERELARVREAHFTARTPATKRKYRERDAALRAELAELLKQDGWDSKTARMLAAWDPYDQNASASFFDAEWMFGVTEGFDVVIGNPPYLESRSPAFSDEIKDALLHAVEHRWKNLDPAVHVTRGADLLVYFFETSVALARSDGCIVLITQNAWLDTDYGKRFQEFLLKITHVSFVVDSDFKHFESEGGPNINTVITFFRGRRPDPARFITFARFADHLAVGTIPSDGATIERPVVNVRYRQYTYGSPILRSTKWGVLLSLDDAALDLLSVLTERGCRIENVPGAQLRVGQGLNLNRRHFVDVAYTKSLPFLQEALIPILTADDGAPFRITRTRYSLADATKLSTKDARVLEKHGLATFDPTKTTKSAPALILPRGIGRHFCAMNACGAYSASAVDIYAESDGADRDVLLNLWIVLNSSVAWLLREVTGRKNLGGGMLKAEATDLAALPIFVPIEDKGEIGRLAKLLSAREAKDALTELGTEEHRRIDDLVFAAIDLDGRQRSTVIQSLKAHLAAREKKART